MPSFLDHDAVTMTADSHDEFRTCPHCGQRTRHSIVRERVLAPVLWCLGCYRTRIGDDDETEAAAKPAQRLDSRTDQPFRLAG